MKFFFYIFIFCFLLLHINVYSETITVSKNSGINKISAALKTANDFDTILVEQGRYIEREIIIEKSIVLLGINSPVIDAQAKGEIIIVRANDVTISGFIIKNSGISYLHENAGVRLDEVSGSKISNNKFINNFFAIYLAKSFDCEISNNFIEGEKKKETNSGNGIHLWYCKNIKIENNVISNHRDGIYFEFVRHGFVKNNKSFNNLRYGLHFMFSDSCIYVNNTFSDNGAGVAVMYTKNVQMDKNIFKDNTGSASYGILLKEISDSRVDSNKFKNNSTGIYMEGCNRVHIENNLFEKNGWAIKLMANSMENYFRQNDFISNSFDVATNSRQNFNLFEKNYWNDYSGYDLDKNGIGDVPYRPVKIFSVLVQQQPASLVLLHSLFADLLNIAESVMPSLTPKGLIDEQPIMRRIN